MALTSRELLAKAFDVPSFDHLSPTKQACLPEMDVHLQQYPHDYNFNLVSDQPGEGYGTLLCMENLCMVEITLGASFTAEKGGIDRGLGGFINYWDHIKTHPTHVQERNKRANVEQTQAASSPAHNSRTALQPRNSGLSSEMDNWGMQGASSDVDIKTRSLGKPPKKRPSNGLKPHSSAGNLYTDDDFDVDKKPKIDTKPEPGVLADRGNAPRSTGSNNGGGGRKTPAEEIKSLEDKLQRFELFAKELRALKPAERESNHWDELDQMNQKINTVLIKISDWENVNGPRPSVRQAQAQAPVFPPPARQDLGIGGSNGNAGGGGVAGGMNYHFADDVLQRLRLEQLRQAGAAGGAGGGGGDAMAQAMNQLSGIQGGVIPGAPSSDGADPYDIANGAVGRRAGAGPRGEEFDEFVKKALEGDSFEGNANVDAAASSLGLKSQHECIPNMTIPLMPHQLIGVAWMKAQEESKHYGGILADEMGLGKTVESIALMCANESQDPDEKSTLIVAPLALLQQWKEEIEDKTTPDYFSVLIYHGPDRKKIKLKKLKKYDVVLTTYSTLVLDFPDDEGAVKKAKAKAKKSGGDADDYFEFQEKGPLLQIGWYRVILDEAQNIRNRQTKMSRAVAGLDALMRWSLSGTPITNSLSDLFPLFRFMQLKPWYDWSEFRQHIMTFEKKRPDLAGKRAQAILRACMLRRKKDSKLDGKELISLPQKHVELLSLEFSEEEREIYDAIEKKAQVKFKKMLRNGTVLKNYSHVLVMLLRLRQLCFHPALIADAEATLQKKEHDKERFATELARAKKEVGPEFVRKIKADRLESAVERAKAEKSGEEGSAGNDECSICFEDILANESGGAVTRCGHSYCRPCITEHIGQAQLDDAGDEASAKCKDDQRPCPHCRSPVGEKDLYPLEAFEPSEEALSDKLGVEMDVDDDDEDADESLGGFIVQDDEDEEDSDRAVVKKVPKQMNRAVIQDSDDEDDHRSASEAEEDNASESRNKKKKDVKGKGKGKAAQNAESKRIRQAFMREQLPSTKMKWVTDELERLFAESPDDKVIIISSFTSMLDMLQDYLDSKDIKTCRYQGDMKNDERQQSLKTLKKSKKCKVMLLSLKCGGVGLTLTRANRVISLDLAWSFAIESQAYDRTHRIGQMKEVFVKRLTIANTVEQRIYDLQAKKQGLADASLGEGKAARFGKLSVKDLAALFGLSV